MTVASDHNGRSTSHIDAQPMTVAIVLDKSGSMEPLREAVIDAYNRFLGELGTEGEELRVSLTSFDTSFHHLYVAEPLASVPPLRYDDYQPGGMTALFDAIAHTTLETDRQLRAVAHDQAKVLVAVITDGAENSSTDYDAVQLAALVADYESRGNWTFVYLGTDATLSDAQHVSARMGIKAGNAMRWDASEGAARATMGSLAKAAKVRRAAPGKRSDQVFADAGQSEEDYSGSGDATAPRLPHSPPRPASRRRPLQKRSLREELDEVTASKPGNPEASR